MTNTSHETISVENSIFDDFMGWADRNNHPVNCEIVSSSTDSETKWVDGPVVEAMKRGAVLLLDELDLGTEKIMCLQSVLEGKGIFVKKTNTWIVPAKGFTVIATGNTKGQGDDTNKFIGANVMNEAFLERFPIWLEQSYPTESIEKKIVAKLFETSGLEKNDDLVEVLVKFANQTRKTYDDHGCDDLITTRRLCLIVELMPVFGSPLAALEVACNRFCEESKNSFISLFKALVDEADKKNSASPYESNESKEKKEYDVAVNHPF